MWQRTAFYRYSRFSSWCGFGIASLVKAHSKASVSPTPVPEYQLLQEQAMYVLKLTMLQLLEQAQKPFIIHGFPRYLYQAIYYEREVRLSNLPLTK